MAQLHHDVKHNEAMPAAGYAYALLKAKISQIPNVLQNPAPDVEILDFNFAGPVLAVRPDCNNDHYWQVYFDANKAIRETFGEAGYPAPEYRYAISGSSGNGISTVMPPLSEIT